MPHSPANLTPETACGPDYHEFSPPLPASPHTPRTISVKDILSDEFVVEGRVISKHAHAGAGVENEIKFRLTKVLKGLELTAGDTLTVHVQGGYAPDDRDGQHVCLEDTLSDGARIEVGKQYLVPLDKESDTDAYRSQSLAGWFRIESNGNIVPLTPALVQNKALAGMTITDIENRAKEQNQ